MTKVGRNDPCPCGSGKKYKRCCLASSAPAGYTQDERASAFAKLESHIETELGPEDDDAYQQFYERWHERLEELDGKWTQLSEAAYDMWFAYDCELTPGRRAVDLFLDTDPLLSSSAAVSSSSAAPLYASTKSQTSRPASR